MSRVVREGVTKGLYERVMVRGRGRGGGGGFMSAMCHALCDIHMLCLPCPLCDIFYRVAVAQ